MISLGQLRTFLEVARLGSVGDAAETLVVSQPAVSASLAALQRELGARLIERDGRGIRLTEAGSVIVEYGNRIFAMLETAGRRAREVSGASAGHLRLAAVTTAAEYLVPDLLQRFREREPGIDVELEVGNHDRVWDRLVKWQVDLVLAGRPPHGAAIRTLATRSHALIVVGPPGVADAPETLARGTWLLREPGSGTRAATEAFLTQLGLDPPRLTIGSNGAIQACARAGLGLSLVSSDAVRADLEAGTLRAIRTPFTPLERQWHLAGAADREPVPAAARFTAFASEALGFRVSAGA